ncbi:HAMP domain-containing protein [Peribacillus saganii]|uniref:histidine kinase n=1 Tax=Peribacillus saganii TaxID=2303992 RepID=A0A372LAE0_9BACI|nr:HAMP domain-containing sensor histidine kinase [Peribacillus saganii]RFU62607.1 HAMP domain-containing protein [Peribacillus saganii]
MKEIKLNLSQKVLLLILVTIGFTILFSFFFLHFLYKDLYLSSIRESVIYQGERTASHYHYGSLSDEIIEKIHWYNVVSEYEIIVVDKLKDLYSYFPYEINDDALVNIDDRKQLIDGNYILKEGYVKEFDRTVVGAIFPIKNDTALIGYIYIYVPLAAIQEVFQGSIPILILTGTAYFLVLFLVVNRIRRSLFQPLTDIRNFSKEVSTGNYSNRLYPQNTDEVGELAEAFNSMSRSLEQQEERKKEFISNVVHELRTPLTYIGGYTQALKQQIFTSPEEAEKYLITIEKETDRLTKLIHDLVDLNHLQENLYILEKEPIAIAQLLFDTLDLFQIHVTDKNLNIKLSVQDDLIIFGDPKRIQQVLYNVVDNAIKYSTKNTEIQIKLNEVYETMLFEVTNKGIIIQEEDINRIGERFFRTDKARGRSTGGSGLGLSIVKEIVQLHSGHFSITSHSIQGTTVTIKLPLLS